MTTNAHEQLGALLARAVRQYRAATDPAVRAAWLAVLRRLTGGER